jgi:hypothetical protein
MGTAFVYAAYLAVSIGLTVIVASALSRSGRVYLAEAFGGDDGMAAAVNRMLVVGFCLLSLGYAALTLRTSADIRGPGQAISVLSVKVGEELLVLGALHLVNMMFFTRLRRRQEAGGRPGAPAAGRGRRGIDWPRAAAVPGRPATVDRPGSATVTGKPGGTDRPGAGVTSGELAAASGQLVATGSGQFGATLPGEAGTPDPGWPSAGGLAAAGPGQLAAAWPAPAAAREALH